MPVTYGASGAVYPVTSPIQWPTGSVPGQLAVLMAATSYGGWQEFTTPAGWKLADASSTSRKTFWKIITAGDLLAPVVLPKAVPMTGSVTAGAQIGTLNGALRLGNQSTLSPVDGGVLVIGSRRGTIRPNDRVINIRPDQDAGVAWFYPQPAGGVVQVDGSYEFFVAVEPRPSPSVPIQVAPAAAAEISATDDIRLAWIHQDPPNPQQNVQVQARRVGDPTWLSVTASGTLTATDTTISTVQQQLVLKGNAVDDNVVYEWRVRTSSLDRWSPFSVGRTFTQVTPPTVTVYSPTGTLNNDLSPTVSWTFSAGGGRVQTSYRVRVTGPSGTLYDSGVLLGQEKSFTTPPINFTNGGSYNFWVDATQTGGASGSGFNTSTITWTVPAPPTFNATPSSTGIRLAVSNTVDTVFDIERSVNGAAWVPFLTGQRQNLAQVIVSDVLAPYLVNVQYQVRTATVLEGTKLPTAWVRSAVIQSTDTYGYFVDSRNPTSFVKLIMLADTDRKIMRAGSVSYPLAGLPTVDYGPTQGQSGALQLFVETAADAATLTGFLKLNRPLWLRWLPDDDRDVPAILMAVTPDPITFERPIQRTLAARDFALNWVETTLEEN